MVSDDEYLERIVRGINAFANPDADVRWNEKIGGRQFDVVVRFTSGPYRFLLVVEVKDKTRKVSASEIEAFITKADDQLADKKIFVASAGYQSGAIEVAKKHGVELFSVTFLPGTLEDTDDKTFILLKRSKDGSVKFEGVARSIVSSEPTLAIGNPTEVNVIDKCKLHYSDGSCRSIPSEPTQMKYYMERSKFSDGRSIHDVIREDTTTPIRDGKRVEKVISIDPPLAITPPDFYFIPAGHVKGVEFSYFSAFARPLTGNAQIEPTSVAPKVEYKNINSGETITMDASALPVADGRIEIDHFYFGYHPLRYFYCDGIDGDVIKFILVESFQSGQLFQATVRQDRKYAWQYMPVRDEDILARLRSRLADYKRLPSKKL